ncbi:MAG: hypothetical protein CMJ78_25305 [Planctomycetaceae bacterium]|nr:hypothetical protein [Planctomycetaceae bacterium]
MFRRQSLQLISYSAFLCVVLFAAQLPAQVKLPRGVNPGWLKDRFPEHAVSYKTPKEIAEIYKNTRQGQRNAVVSYTKPKDGSLRIVATGHSFMVPGFRTFPLIAKASGLKQPPLVTHVGGGMTGSTRYKWEQENGIFQFDRRPVPRLLASISNAEWDAMLWGPYYNDRIEYYSCWIDFCLKYNPKMKFYLSDAWPQIAQFGKMPKSEDEFDDKTMIRLEKEKQDAYHKLLGDLNKKYDNRVFILPTCEAMVLAVQYYNRGELPGVEGIHSLVGKKRRSLWRDRIGHLGPGFANLEGYVFYATLYGRSPKKIEGDIPFPGSQDYPSKELDRQFRKIAWQAVLNDSRSGVVDKNKNGIADDRE